MRPSFVLMLLLAAGLAAAEEPIYDFKGHAKFRLIGFSIPQDSILFATSGSESLNIESDLRLNFSASNGGWTFDSAYQLFALNGDNVEWANDDLRLFNFSDTIHEKSKTIVAHRLDRLWVGYSNEKTVLRFGRQALTWGNGLFFTPMDLVNPFDPAAIDTEFKSGDDMLYLQYLRDNGDDIQGAVVFRRDPVSMDVRSDQATTTLKYHGFVGENEYDVLLAENYDATVLGVGGVRSIGGAVLRGDLVVTDSLDGSVVQLVANLSHSWLWNEKNVSGAVEYFYDDGVDYVAGSLTIELSPLWTTTPTLLINASDRSALLQLTTGYSVSDNMAFLGSLNLPIGANGTEYGGSETGVPGQYLSIDWGVFAQLAWYF
ncbi:MAG: hypothetical protein ACR2QT_14730 [Woeseiaceae bacterium]